MNKSNTLDVYRQLSTILQNESTSRSRREDLNRSSLINSQNIPSSWTTIPNSSFNETICRVAKKLPKSVPIEVQTKMVGFVSLSQKGFHEIYRIPIDEILKPDGQLYTPGSNVLKDIIEGISTNYSDVILNSDLVWVLGKENDPEFIRYLRDTIVEKNYTNLAYNSPIVLIKLREIYQNYGLHSMVIKIDQIRNNNAKWCSIL